MKLEDAKQVQISVLAVTNCFLGYGEFHGDVVLWLYFRQPKNINEGNFCEIFLPQHQPINSYLLYIKTSYCAYGKIFVYLETCAITTFALLSTLPNIQTSTKLDLQAQVIATNDQILALEAGNFNSSLHVFHNYVWVTSWPLH